ncbi:unnamed protein product [Diatraea saccharalis]|uniref:Uncharacterized protein n=1 Tax=Diatraea saccharalis TaxID=40085 RepID=A0A9N9WEH6_9NEOP|nr:unnamed protein product [Diatraea saccharalis]
MSLDTWKVEKGLCRCCHADGIHTNLAEPQLQKGQQEIYANIMQQCFNINLHPVQGPLCTITYSICDLCAQRLLDAYSFKKQVMQCEERFHNLYNKNMIKLTSSYEVDIKVEISDEDVEDVKPVICVQVDENNDFDFNNEDDDGDDSKEMQLDTEEEQSTTSQPKKPKAKPKAKGQTRKSERSAKAKQDKAEKAKKGDGPTAPKFRLMDTDYTTEGDVFKCSKCERPYDKLSSLRYHVKTKHYNIPRFPCSYCSEGFMTPAPLTIHKLKEHNVDDRFKCNACKGTFNTRVQLRKHINNFHMLGEKYKCEFCEYESFSFEGMYKHKFKHKTVKDYHCRFCRKAFLRKTTLDLHERIHTGDRRKVCSVCSKAFVQKASLNYHMAKYHPEVNF